MKNAENLPILSFETQQNWEAWLKEHHADTKGLWLMIKYPSLDSVSRWAECPRWNDQRVRVVHRCETVVQNPQQHRLCVNGRHRKSPTRGGSDPHRSHGGSVRHDRERGEVALCARAHLLSHQPPQFRRKKSPRSHQVSRRRHLLQHDRNARALRGSTWCDRQLTMFRRPAPRVLRAWSGRLLAILRGVLEQRHQKQEMCAAVAPQLSAGRCYVLQPHRLSSCRTVLVARSVRRMALLDWSAALHRGR